MNRILTIIKEAMTIPPVVIDGAVIIAIQMLTYLQTSFGTDEAAKWIAPMTLFWIKVSIGEFAAGLLALKMFRSTAYASYQQDKKDENNTKIFVKQQEQQKDQ